MARIWDAGAGKELAVLRHGRAFTHAVDHVAFSPDGLTVVTAGADNTARLWDAATGSPTFFAWAGTARPVFFADMLHLLR